MAKDLNKKVAKDSKKNSKDKRHFSKDFKAELKKVIWPTPKQLLNNTVAVVSIVIITAIIVLVLDLGFEALNEHGINKLRSMVDNTTLNTQIDNTTLDETNNTTTENVEAQENNESVVNEEENSAIQ